ncbi:MAG: hypothetical protein HKN67_09730 [Saprospiraceae bacterium]|nr:hypothetical protein [Bacteroidia bacterium]MBT8230256.1 hypothetical protein [Bacteroidia bacterium]NNF22212.1 hypothetical protein [Saprospiraceae bacterium]
MKQLLLILISVITLCSFTTKMEDITLLSTKHMKIYVSECCESIFNYADYNEEESMLEFETNKEIAFLQVFNSNEEMEFQLNVMSDKVMISESLLSSGINHLGFVMKDKSEIHFTEVLFIQ